MKYTAEQYLERIENKRLKYTPKLSCVWYNKKELKPIYSRKDMIDFAEKYAEHCVINSIAK